MADLALNRSVAPPSRWIAGLKRGGARLWIGAALVGVLVLVALLAPTGSMERQTTTRQIRP